MTTTSTARETLTLLHAGGPSLLLRLGGLTVVSDPGFDEPQVYEAPGGRTLTRTHGPAAPSDALGPLDVALVSHDEHIDNLDLAGRALLPSVPHVLTTVSGAGRLAPEVPQVAGLAAWAHTEIPRPDGGTLRVTGVPALHGPDGAEHYLGDVTGFVLDGEGLPRVYLSGDNADPSLVADIPARLGPVDIAILHAGAARVEDLMDRAPLTLTARDAVEVAQLLGNPTVVPVHADGWTHFSEGLDDVTTAFDDAGLTHLLRVPPRGERMML